MIDDRRYDALENWAISVLAVLSILAMSFFKGC